MKSRRELEDQLVQGLTAPLERLGLRRLGRRPAWAEAGDSAVGVSVVWDSKSADSRVGRAFTLEYVRLVDGRAAGGGGIVGSARLASLLDAEQIRSVLEFRNERARMLERPSDQELATAPGWLRDEVLRPFQPVNNLELWEFLAARDDQDVQRWLDVLLPMQPELVDRMRLIPPDMVVGGHRWDWTAIKGTESLAATRVVRLIGDVAEARLDAATVRDLIELSRDDPADGFQAVGAALLRVWSAGDGLGHFDALEARSLMNGLGAGTDVWEPLLHDGGSRKSRAGGRREIDLSRGPLDEQLKGL